MLPPVRPSAALRIAYQKRLDCLIDEMANSVLYWLRAAYRADQPATVDLGMDSIWSVAFDKLAARWLRRFDDLAPKLADWFAKSTLTRSDTVLRQELRKGGFTVKFQTTKAMRDAYDAVIDENVGLIKSVATQHLDGVRGDLMRAVQGGYRTGRLAQDIEKRTGVTQRRARFIARDQTAKAQATLNATRMIEVGQYKAVWLHSAGGKTPRPEHVAFSGKEFDLRVGHDFGDGLGPVLPGVAINCRCVWRIKVEGFDL